MEFYYNNYFLQIKKKYLIDLSKEKKKDIKSMIYLHILFDLDLFELLIHPLIHLKLLSKNLIKLHNHQYQILQ